MPRRRILETVELPTREQLNALPVAAPDLPAEHHHLYRCPQCGDVVDRRQLGDVLLHEEPHDHSLAQPERLGFVEPMLPTLIAEAPEGDDWLHEIKYDGYRTQLVIDGAGVRAFTRNGFDWSDRYPSPLRAAGEVRCSSAILDGEMIVQDELGRSDFGAFKSAMLREPERIVFMAFDLLHLDGADLRPAPLIERRARLQELVGCHDPSCCIQYSEHVIGGGGAMFNACDRMGLEGIVSKRLRSRYRSGRTRDWLKVKCWAEGEFVVVGLERGQDGPPMALLARESGVGLEYAGGAAVTLGGGDRERFWRAVERLSTGEPIAGAPRKAPAQWLRPELRVRARYLKGSGKLRHATVAGFGVC
jgi:bifunctional non-homologous end joining protein LigD